MDDQERLLGELVAGLEAAAESIQTLRHDVDTVKFNDAAIKEQLSHISGTVTEFRQLLNPPSGQGGLVGRVMTLEFDQQKLLETKNRNVALLVAIISGAFSVLAAIITIFK